MIVLEPDPEVAVIVTVLVPAGVPKFVDVVLLPPPPQLVAIPHTTTSNAIIKPKRTQKDKHFLLRGYSRHKASIDPPPTKGHGSVFPAADAAVVVMVTVVLVALPLGVTVDGEKLQNDSLGNPEHAKDIC